MSLPSFAFEIGIGVGLFVLLLACAEAGLAIGDRAARRRKAQGETADASVGTIQGAMLALLGLLLGFSFAGASGRFIERQDYITQEANAIGTVYLRADLMPDEPRRELRAALKDYTAARVELFETLELQQVRAIHDRMSEQHKKLWAIAMRGIESKPGIMMALLQPLNELFDLHTSRGMASMRHLPGVVIGLLIVSAMFSVGVVGFSAGRAPRVCRPLLSALVLLLTATLWTTIDLDHPKRGLITISAEPLRVLQFE